MLVQNIPHIQFQRETGQKFEGIFEMGNILEKMTGETPEVRSDERKQTKEREKREKRKKKREKRKR